MIKKFTVSIELTDGRLIGPSRVLAADRIAAESLMRRRGWDFEEGPRLYSALAWSVAKRTGETEKDYPEFIDELVDWNVALAEEEEGEEVNPT